MIQALVLSRIFCSSCPLSGAQRAALISVTPCFFLKSLNPQRPSFPVPQPLLSAQKLGYPLPRKSHCALSPQLPDISREVSETGFGRRQPGPGHFHESGSAACGHHHPLRALLRSSTFQTPLGCRALSVFIFFRPRVLSFPGNFCFILGIKFILEKVTVSLDYPKQSKRIGKRCNTKQESTEGPVWLL